MTASRQVIVVEDDRDFRESMVEYLVLNGLDVTGVESALQFYQSSTLLYYDIAILDIGLPDQNGLCWPNIFATIPACALLCSLRSHHWKAK